MPRVLPPVLEPFRAYLRRLEGYFGLSGVGYRDDPGVPDIASIPAQGVILVGRRWRLAGRWEQEKRLLHEAAHLWGVPHDSYARSLGYFSSPRRDRWSREVYEHLRAGAARFDPQRFGVERYAA